MNDESGHTDYHSRDYPVREDMAHQVKVWQFERWGWYFLALVVLLALLGLFSRGPLSTRDVQGDDGKVRVQYERFHRHGSTNPILHKRLRHARLIEADVMEAARSSQGIETLEQIKFAILERNGKISVIAQEPS
ncbi:Protein of unknown function [Pseudomonas frederiksbergensis]|uniref:YetF C-terminal domain-containing protein n=1 Tax=Pseudomonas frederiksbergensis TaxID=104087 RepID=A0A1H5CFX1_9PSED|nr:YetF domain-containing protein [Pseudomonas frederiksbergensis]SED65477.1 Protein of unknown function [Pseudomonas frederiksbergensis]